MGGGSGLLLFSKTTLLRSEASENLNDHENCPSGQPRTLCPKNLWDLGVVILTVNSKKLEIPPIPAITIFTETQH